MTKLRTLLAALTAIVLTQSAWAIETREVKIGNLVYKYCFDLPTWCTYTKELQLVGIEGNPTTLYIPYQVTTSDVTYSLYWNEPTTYKLSYPLLSENLPWHYWDSEWTEADDDEIPWETYYQRMELYQSEVIAATNSVTQLSIPFDAAYKSNTNPDYAYIFGFKNVEYLNLYSQESQTTILCGKLMQDHTKLQKVDYPDNVTAIYSNCFNGCTSLSDFTLKPTIASIGEKAFLNCSSLSSSTLFDNCTALAEIGTEAFKGCTALPKITFNREVSLGESAFAGCTGLTRATFNGKATLDASALANCTSLSAATFSGEALLGSNTFQGCSSLTSITIGSLNPQSDASVFNYGALRSLTIQSMNSTVLGMTLCRNCSQLQTINFPASFFQQSQLPEGYFEGCTNLTQQLEFSNLNYIGSKVFSGISGLNLKLTGSGGISMATDAFQNTTGTLYVRYGLRDYYASHQATKHLTIVEYDAPDPTSYQVVAAESLPSWYSQYTTAQLSAVKHLKVTGELTTESLTTICNLCKNNGGSVQLQALDLTEVTNETLQSFPAGAFTLDTLYLPRATQTLGGDFFNTFSNDIVVVASWTTNLPARTWTEASVSSRTLIVPRGSLYTYKAADGWKGFGTIKLTELEGDASMMVFAGKGNAPTELYVDGAQVGTIAKKGGMLSQTVGGSASVELRIPTQYLDKILLNGTDVKALLTADTPTDAAYSGYKFYYVEDLTATTLIEIVYEGVPEVFETYGLMFAIDGGPGTANVTITYGDGTSETFDMELDGDGSTCRPINYYTTTPTGKVYAATKEIEKIVVRAHPNTDESTLIYFFAGYPQEAQIYGGMYDLVYDGSGTYTYTLLGENMTSSNIYMTFPAQQENSVKTTIKVADGIQVGYFFYMWDPGSWYHNVSMSEPGTYINGTVDVYHSSNEENDNYGNVFIYVPEGDTNFRVILNGEVVNLGRNGDVWLFWDDLVDTSYDTYMKEHYGDDFTPIACYNLSLADSEMAEDSWIVIDDGTTPLDQIVSPWQITQNLSCFGDGVLNMTGNGGSTVTTLTDGQTKTLSWEKGAGMTLSVTPAAGIDFKDYEAHLIIDGADHTLAKTVDTDGKATFEPFQLSSIASSHTIILVTKKIGTTLIGDVNGDGLITIADVTALVNIILGK